MLTALQTSTPSLAPPPHTPPPSAQLSAQNQRLDKPLPHLVPMVTPLPPPRFLMNPGAAGYTLFPASCDAFGGMASLQPIGSFAGAVATLPYYSPPEKLSVGSPPLQPGLVGLVPPMLPIDHSPPSVSIGGSRGDSSRGGSSVASPAVESKPVLSICSGSGLSAREGEVNDSALSQLTPPDSSSASPSSSRPSPNPTPTPNAATAPEGANMEPMDTSSRLCGRARVVKGTSEEEEEEDEEDEEDDDDEDSMDDSPARFVEVKREPVNEEGLPRLSTCARRNSESNLEEAASLRSSYSINALIDVPRSLESRTPSLSSSLSSFRFGGSLSTLWAASQMNVKNLAAPNMKSTGNLAADTSAMPSLSKQYYAFGGSLPELSLTSLSRLLPNSSANETSITSCPSLFTLFHPPLYVYPSQQPLGTPFINANGSISFGSFLSTGNSLCSTIKSASSDASSRVGTGRSSASGSRSNITGQENTVDEEFARPLSSSPHTALASTASSSSSSSISLPAVSNGGSFPLHPSAMKMYAYSPLTAGVGGAGPGGALNVVAALPGFGTLAYNLDGMGASPTPSSSSSVAPSYSSPATTAQVSTANLTTLACVATAQQRQDHAPAPAPSCLLPRSSASPMRHLRTIQEPVDSKAGILSPLGAQPGDLFLHPSPTSPDGIPPTGLSVLHVPKLEKDGTVTMCSGGAGSPGDSGAVELSPLLSSVNATHPQVTEYARQGVKKEKDRPYKCDHPGCGRSFSFPAHLRSHIQQIHISYRPCKCEFPSCGKRFYTPQHLNVHRRVHTGERPFVCPYAECSKAFTTAGNLKNHIRTHTGERPYACKFDGCIKRFAEMSSLKKHELTHTGEKPYKCRVCGKAFSQAGSRNTHERKHNRSDEEDGSPDGKASKRYRIKRMALSADSS